MVTTDLKKTVQHVLAFARRSGCPAPGGEVTSEATTASRRAATSQYGVLPAPARLARRGGGVANLLIGEKLAACVQLLPIESTHVWHGEGPKMKPKCLCW